MLSLTARRVHAARAIKTSLAEARGELFATPPHQHDKQADLHALIHSLETRLTNRRATVLNARYRSLKKPPLAPHTCQFCQAPAHFGFGPPGWSKPIYTCQNCRPHAEQLRR